MAVVQRKRKQAWPEAGLEKDQAWPPTESEKE
jgi:hypothetical protein